jgi:hypothetical protein
LLIDDLGSGNLGVEFVDNLKATAVFLDEKILGFLVGSVARDGVDLGLYCGHERVIGFKMIKVVRERDDIVGIFREFLTTKLLGFDGAVFPFRDPGALVAFHGDDQDIAHGFSFLEKIDVFLVEEVEETGG